MNISSDQWKALVRSGDLAGAISTYRAMYPGTSAADARDAVNNYVQFCALHQRAPKAIILSASALSDPQ